MITTDRDVRDLYYAVDKLERSSQSGVYLPNSIRILETILGSISKIRENFPAKVSTSRRWTQNLKIYFSSHVFPFCAATRNRVGPGCMRSGECPLSDGATCTIQDLKMLFADRNMWTWNAIVLLKASIYTLDELRLQEEARQEKTPAQEMPAEKRVDVRLLEDEWEVGSPYPTSVSMDLTFPDTFEEDPIEDYTRAANALMNRNRVGSGFEGEDLGRSYNVLRGLYAGVLKWKEYEENRGRDPQGCVIGLTPFERSLPMCSYYTDHFSTIECDRCPVAVSAFNDSGELYMECDSVFAAFAPGQYDIIRKLRLLKSALELLEEVIDGRQ